MSEVFKAISDPSRRMILDALRDSPLSAGEIADKMPISKSTLSGHLQILKNAKLVEVTRKGNSLIYRLNISVLEGALVSFMNHFKIQYPQADEKE